jgi:NADH-quinone oxidoreductase subunit H
MPMFQALWFNLGGMIRAMFHLIQPTTTQTYILPMLCAVIIVLALPVLAGCVLIAERKLITHFRARHRPDTVTHDLLGPIAGVTKLLLTEDLTSVDPLIFWVAPLVSWMVAMLGLSVLPIGGAFQIADLNIGLLFILGTGSLAAYGVLLGGWASHTGNSLTAALDRAAQLISYETVTIVGLLSALLLSGSLSMKEIVQAQLDRGQWFIFYVPVGFAVYFLGSLAVTSDAPFDSAHPDTETVAGCSALCTSAHTGFGRGLYLLAGYANLIVVACVATTVFLGGWLRPLAGYRDRFPGTSVELLDVLPAIATVAAGVYCFWRGRKLPASIQRTGAFSAAGLCAVAAALLSGVLFAPESFTQGVHGAFWFLVKVGAYIYFVFWFQYELSPAHLAQRRRLDWRILIPVAFVNLITAGVAILTSQNAGWPMRLTTVLATLATLGVSWWLFKNPLGENAVLTTGGE